MTTISDEVMEEMGFKSWELIKKEDPFAELRGKPILIIECEKAITLTEQKVKEYYEKREQELLQSQGLITQKACEAVRKEIIEKINNRIMTAKDYLDAKSELQKLRDKLKQSLEVK